MSRLAQLVERKTFNLVVVGSSPTVGAFFRVVDPAVRGAPFCFAFRKLRKKLCKRHKKVRRPGIKPGSGPWQGPILSLNYRRWPQVLPGIEPGFRDSESPVITVTLQDLRVCGGDGVDFEHEPEHFTLEKNVLQAGIEPATPGS